MSGITIITIIIILGKVYIYILVPDTLLITYFDDYKEYIDLDSKEDCKRFINFKSVVYAFYQSELFMVGSIVLYQCYYFAQLQVESEDDSQTISESSANTSL